jgi:hypothetical protein
MTVHAGRAWRAWVARLIEPGRVVAMLVLAAGLSGCLTPSVRYTRGGARVSEGSYVVPRNWDYRKDYKIPVSRLRAIVDSYIGTPYRYGGTSRRGVDCSGFVYLVFRELNGAKLPRTTRKQHRLGRAVGTQSGRPGDLVFFRGGPFGWVNHVGIYLGKGRFAHASSKKGVIYSSLDQEYYEKHFSGLRRLF